MGLYIWRWPTDRCLNLLSRSVCGILSPGNSTTKISLDTRVGLIVYRGNRHICMEKQFVVVTESVVICRDPECKMMASCSKDNSIIIWNTTTCERVITLTGHTQSVTCIKWSGTDHIFSSSQDRTVKMWDPKVCIFWMVGRELSINFWPLLKIYTLAHKMM